MADSDEEKYLKANFYEMDLPADIGPARETLESYSHIPKDEVDDHIRRIVGLLSSQIYDY
jgi:hypothetical protein